MTAKALPSDDLVTVVTHELLMTFVICSLLMSRKFLTERQQDPVSIQRPFRHFLSDHLA